MGIMERFGYRSLKEARAESTEILRLLEAESYGQKKDEEEELEEQKAKIEQEQQRAQQAH